MTEANRQGYKLLAEAKAQQATNRDSLLRSQQEQRDLGAIGRLGGLAIAKANIARIGGVASGDPPRRRPEPPTPTLQNRGAFAIWGAVDDYAYHDSSAFPGLGTERNFTLYSLNCQNSITTSLAYPTSAFFDSIVTYYALPIDKTNVILVIASYARDGSSQDLTEAKAFKIGWSTIREITLPTNSGINLIAYDYLYRVGHPPYTQGDVRSLGIYFSARYGSQIGTWFSVAKFGELYCDYERDYIGNQFPSDPFVGQGYLHYNSPGIYSMMLDPEGAYAALEDAGDYYDIFTKVHDFINAAELPEYSYAVSTISRKYNTLLRYTIKLPTEEDYATYHPPVDGVEDPLWTLDRIVSSPTPPTNPYTGPRSLIFPVLFWNWDQPEYCRQKLLDCGFAPEDLVG